MRCLIPTNDEGTGYAMEELLANSSYSTMFKKNYLMLTAVFGAGFVFEV